ncbi:MAG: DUF1819 domain-containing protein [Deltaproteobacteria bacterium]|nr:MAG: DUF1819 domain-containing protein [Deltaproteobacteria bacterium]
MSDPCTETTAIHSRLLKCALEIEASRAYWSHTEPGTIASAHEAFERYWFGSKSLARVQVLLINLRARFDAYPQALAALHHWPDMNPDTRSVICHWHLQLTDPLYRAFTGDLLVERRGSLRPEVTRDVVVGWVSEQGPERWTLPTRIQCASKLLSSAYAAGLVGSNRDPRPIALPRVPDDALTYMLYLLREVDYEGELLDNPYLRSVGLDGRVLDDRLRGLSALRFQRQADLVDFGWQYPSFSAWAQASGRSSATGGAA